MKVLIACEESQTVCKAFRAKGHEAYSCDIIEPPGDTACENWSNDPADKDKPQDALRYFVDHYWDEEATND